MGREQKKCHRKSSFICSCPSWKIAVSSHQCSSFFCRWYFKTFRRLQRGSIFVSTVQMKVSVDLKLHILCPFFMKTFNVQSFRSLYWQQEVHVWYKNDLFQNTCSQRMVAMYCVRLNLVYFQAWIEVACPVCTAKFEMFVFQCHSFEWLEKEHGKESNVWNPAEPFIVRLAVAMLKCSLTLIKVILAQLARIALIQELVLPVLAVFSARILQHHEIFNYLPKPYNQKFDASKEASSSGR